MSVTLVWLLCLLTLLIGALIPIQAASNALLSRAVGGVAPASLVLFATGFCVVALYTLVMRAPLPALGALKDAPAGAFLGGFIVATYVIAITYLAPRLGMGTAIAFIVTGQILSAALIDHFGLLGSTVRTMDLQRLIGIGLMIAGVFLAKRT